MLIQEQNKSLTLLLKFGKFRFSLLTLHNEWSWHIPSSRPQINDAAVVRPWMDGVVVLGFIVWLRLFVGNWNKVHSNSFMKF